MAWDMKGDMMQFVGAGKKNLGPFVLGKVGPHYFVIQILGVGGKIQKSVLQINARPCKTFSRGICFCSSFWGVMLGGGQDAIPEIRAVPTW